MSLEDLIVELEGSREEARGERSREVETVCSGGELGGLYTLPAIRELPHKSIACFI